MTDARDIEDLKRLGAGRPAPEDVKALYREAFRTFGAAALWSRTPSEHPTVAQALAVAESSAAGRRHEIAFFGGAN